MGEIKTNFISTELSTNYSVKITDKENQLQTQNYMKDNLKFGIKSYNNMVKTNNVHNKHNLHNIHNTYNVHNLYNISNTHITHIIPNKLLQILPRNEFIIQTLSSSSPENLFFLPKPASNFSFFSFEFSSVSAEFDVTFNEFLGTEGDYKKNGSEISLEDWSGWGRRGVKMRAENGAVVNFIKKSSLTKEENPSILLRYKASPEKNDVFFLLNTSVINWTVTGSNLVVKRNPVLFMKKEGEKGDFNVIYTFRFFKENGENLGDIDNLCVNNALESAISFSSRNQSELTFSIPTLSLPKSAYILSPLAIASTSSSSPYFFLFSSEKVGEIGTGNNVALILLMIFLVLVAFGLLFYCAWYKKKVDEGEYKDIRILIDESISTVGVNVTDNKVTEEDSGIDL